MMPSNPSADVVGESGSSNSGLSSSGGVNGGSDEGDMSSSIGGGYNLHSPAAMHYSNAGPMHYMGFPGYGYPNGFNPAYGYPHPGYSPRGMHGGYPRGPHDHAGPYYSGPAGYGAPPGGFMIMA